MTRTQAKIGYSRKEIVEAVRTIPVDVLVPQIWKKSSTEVRLTSATEDRGADSRCPVLQVVKEMVEVDQIIPRAHHQLKR